MTDSETPRFWTSVDDILPSPGRLGFDDIRRFLAHWQPHRRCRNCDHNMFFVSSTTFDRDGPPLRWVEKGAVEAAGPIVMLECDRCGLVDLFDAAIVAKWVSENPNG